MFCKNGNRYNKTLLGDDMGRFPAPMLMNTIHFSMQAVFANAVTYFWSERFQPTVTMSWKDYFMRGKNLKKNKKFLCSFMFN